MIQSVYSAYCFLWHGFFYTWFRRQIVLSLSLLTISISFPHAASAINLTGMGSAEVSAGEAYDSVYGSLAREGNATADGGLVTVTGGTILRGIYGGSAQSGSGYAFADDNSVVISGGLNGFDYDIYGGNAQSGNGAAEARNNSVVIGGTPGLGVWASVIGGYARNSLNTGGTAEATGNVVKINDGTSLYRGVGGSAYGTANTATQAYASSNTVEVNGGTVNLLYGGTAISDGLTTAGGNTVIVNGGNVDEVIGGDAYSREGIALADGNRVLIRGGQTQDLFGASVQGSIGTASASGNTVYVANATVNNHVSGGFAPMSTIPAIVSRNTIVIDGGAVVTGNVHGGDVTGDTPGSQADSNIIVVTGGGSVARDLYGGVLEAAGSSSYNTVLVKSGSVSGDICGGDGGPGGTAVCNNVIIGSGARLALTTSLYGGVVGSGIPVTAAGSGNVLFVDSWQGKVTRTAGFANYHFVLPAPGAPVDVPMLTVTDAQPGDFAGTVVTAQLPDITTGGRRHLGETFTLLSDASGAISQAEAGSLIGLQQGYITLYNGLLVNTGTDIQLTLTDMQFNPRTAALNEARAGSTGVLNQGMDLTANTGVRRARTAALDTELPAWTPFGALYGGTARYHTGSYSDAEGFSLLTGMARRIPLQQSEWILGVFFEFGRAHLGTFNDFSSEDVDGRGDSQYAGGGLLARMEVSHGLFRGWYIEGSLRMGEVNTSWISGDLLDNMDRPAEYDITTLYYGGHAGIGRVISLGERLRSDLYGKYFLTHQGGEHVDLYGDGVDFHAITSSRLLLGGRLEYALKDGVTPYVGAAWEREFDGTAGAVASGFTIPSASLRGNSGVFELGVSVSSGNFPCDVDLSIQGSTGVRDSLGGSVQVSWEF